MKTGKYAQFPDAVTTRGLKHLKTLTKAREEGFRAVMLYIIQRMDVEIFTPAYEIDPQYADGLKKAVKGGVEIIPLQVRVSPESIELFRELPWEI